MRLARGWRNAAQGRRGLTVLELMIGSSILILLGLGIATSTATMEEMTFQSGVDDHLQHQARKAREALSTDLRLAGELSVSIDGAALDYPHLFEPGDLDSKYGGFEHDADPAPKAAEPGDVDFVEDRGVLMLMPADADEDGAPDFSLITGELSWAHDERVSYTRRWSSDGRSSLVRTLDGGQARIVARDVEYFRCEMNSPQAPEVPLGAVRVRIGFRAADPDGVTHRHALEFLVRMRSHG